MDSFLVRNGLILALLVLVPTFVGEFWAYQLGLYFLYALAAMGVGLTWGQAGILPLGQGMFVALAAYATAYGLFAFGSSPAAFLVIPVAALGVALCGFLFSAMVFRGRSDQGPSFSLITLALTLAAFQVATSWASVTGGFNGLRNIPGLPGLDGFLDLYYLIAVVLGLGIASVDYLLRAPIGALWRAVADNERRLAFLGYDVAALKAVAFAVACGLAGLAGALYAPQQNLVTPDPRRLYLLRGSRDLRRGGRPGDSARPGVRRHCRRRALRRATRPLPLVGNRDRAVLHHCRVAVARRIDDAVRAAEAAGSCAQSGSVGIARA